MPSVLFCKPNLFFNPLLFVNKQSDDKKQKRYNRITRTYAPSVIKHVTRARKVKAAKTVSAAFNKTALSFIYGQASF